MPPLVFIDPQFVETLKEISEDREYNGHPLKTENEFNEDRETAEQLKNSINEIITRKTQQIERRIQANELFRNNTWVNNAPQYHIMGSDISVIFQDLDAICENCDATITEINYRAQATEYGTASLSIIEGTTDYEGNETNTDGDYEFTCKECDNAVSPHRIPYFIPQESLNNLIAYGRIFTERQNASTEGLTTRTIRQQEPTEDTEIRRRWRPGQRETVQATNEFPDGKQIQKDINGHGPSGPQMHTSAKGILESTPEDFLFRNTIWTCKSCGNANKGTNRKCGTTSCQKDKFLPTKTIKLTV